MLKAYKLRPEYEDTLVGGTVTTGPDAGTLDIMEALKEGEGEILTGDPLLQSILENYYGAEGLMFSVSQVTGEGGREPLPDSNQTVPPHEMAALAGVAPPPASPTNPPQPSPPMPGQGATTPDAQHGDSSDYESFTVDELRDLVRERELSVPARANKPELVAALEADDNEGDTVDDPS